MGIADVLGLAGTVAENWRNANDARRASYLYELEREQAARLDALRQLELQQDVYGNAPPDIGAVNYAPGQDFIEVAQQQQMMQNALANAGAPTAVPLAPLQQGTPQTASLSSLPQGKPDYHAGTAPATYTLDDPRLAQAAMKTVAAVDEAAEPFEKYLANPVSQRQQQSLVANARDPNKVAENFEKINALQQANESEYLQAMRDISDYQRQIDDGASPARLRVNGARAKYEAAVETLNRMNAPAAQSDEKPAPLPVVYPAPQDTQQAAAQDPLAAVMQMINGGQQAAPAPAPAQVQAPVAPQMPAGVDYHYFSRLNESGDRHTDGNGNVVLGQPVKSHGGDRAVGVSQIMPNTAMAGIVPGAPTVFDVADALGVGYADRSKQSAVNLLYDERVNRLMGQQSFQHLMQRYGGNPLYAAAAYNAGPKNADKWVQTGDFGALPPETQKYVRDYAAKMSSALGSQAYPNMPAPLPGVEQVAPSIAEQSPAVQMDRSQFYLANPASVPRDLQVAVQQRQDMARMANLYRQAGLGHEYMQAAMQVRAADQQIVQLQGMQGISELTFANDPRRLSAIWSQYAGTPVQVVPRSDGKWDIRVNGQTTQQGKTTDEVVKVARSMVDQSYNAAMTKEQLEWQKAVLDSQTKLAERTMMNDNNLAVEQMKGANTAANTAQQHQNAVALKGVEFRNDVAKEVFKQAVLPTFAPSGADKGTYSGLVQMGDGLFGSVDNNGNIIPFATVTDSNGNAIGVRRLPTR